MRLHTWPSWRRWWLLPIAAALGGLGAALVTLVLPEAYRAEATIALTGPTASRELQLTYRELLTSDDFINEVADDLDISPTDLHDGLRAIPSPGTLLIAVVVTRTDAEEAARRANAVAESFDGFLVESGVGPSGSVVVAQRATSAEGTRTMVPNVLLGAVAACIAAAAVLTFVRPPGATPVSADTPRRDDYESVDPA